MLNMGPEMVLGLGTGIAPPSTHPATHPSHPTPGTPPLTVTAVHVLGMLSALTNMVVGLKSVAQLT